MSPKSSSLAGRPSRPPSSTRPSKPIRIPTELRLQIVEMLVLDRGIVKNPTSRSDFAFNVGPAARALLSTCTTIRRDTITVLAQQVLCDFSSIEDLRCFVKNVNSTLLSNIRNIRLDRAFGSESFDVFETEFCNILKTQLQGVSHLFIVGPSWGYMKLNRLGGPVVDDKLTAIMNVTPRLANSKILVGRQRCSVAECDIRGLRRSFLLLPKGKVDCPISVEEEDHDQNGYHELLWAFKDINLRVQVSGGRHG